jgi:hypothetical protein
MPKQCSFPYTKFVNPLEKSISLGRLELYENLAKKAGKTELQHALQLYCWNTSLSQALYWPLHAFEITLRNAMADAIWEAHGDDWFEDIASFSSSRRTFDSDEVKRVIKAKEKLDRDGIPYTHDNIVAAISLGFWTGLLKGEYKAQLWDPLFSQFLQMIDLKEAFEKTHQIKSLRNNIAHYEPIIVFLPRNNHRELYKDYKVILKLIRWICPDTAQWVEYHSAANFLATWNSCPDFLQVFRLSSRVEGGEGDSLNWKWG